MLFVIILIIVFIIMGIISLADKGGFLIAGYNTASKKEKDKYDVKKLNRCMAIMYVVLAIAMGITAYVDTDEFATYFFLPVVLITIVIILIAANTYCKKR